MRGRNHIGLGFPCRFNGMNPESGNVLPRFLNDHEIRHLDDRAHQQPGLYDFPGLIKSWILHPALFQKSLNQRVFKGLDFFELQVSRIEGVLQVMGAVGQRVGNVDDLGFQGGAREALEFKRRLGVIVRRGVAGDSFPGFIAQIQAVISLVPFFQLIHDSQALQVVLKPPIGLQDLVQGLLSRVAEGGMAEIVRQGDGFAEVFVQTQGPAQGSGVLGHFESMREPRPVEISFDDAKDLGLVLEVLEIFAVQDPVAIPLETGAVFILFRTMERSAHGVGALRGIIRQLLAFPFLKPLSGLHVTSYRPTQAPTAREPKQNCFEVEVPDCRLEGLQF